MEIAVSFVEDAGSLPDYACCERFDGIPLYAKQVEGLPVWRETANVGIYRVVYLNQPVEYLSFIYRCARKFLDVRFVRGMYSMAEEYFLFTRKFMGNLRPVENSVFSKWNPDRSIFRAIENSVI